MSMASLLEKIQYISSEMSSHNDHIHAHKALELNSKLTEGQLTIALCGHFSAGKSTLVNTLCGAKLLPSSPIPTSANVVTISYGEQSKAEVEVWSNGTTRYDEVAIEQLEQYCTDGEQFISVNIQYPSPLLKNGLILLDTPGIDSTDAAHKLATESALHMADVVFYVMDYNHVQSEINFSFAKELKEWNKPLYFIVNQIDKHREQELSFSAYEQSVAEAFHAWHLEPAGILYLSLREPNHPHHQWQLLQRLIDELTKKQSHLSTFSVWSSIFQLAKEHGQVIEEYSSEKRHKLLQAIGGEDQLIHVETQLKALNVEISELQMQIEQFPIELRKEIEALLDNANITPAELRDLAHQFLESRKPGFRQGLLFAKGKTAQEQERRQTQFHVELQKLTNAAIEWHLKVLLRNAGKRISFDDQLLEQLLLKVDQNSPSDQLLLSKVNHGAVFGNEYTMTYSKDLSSSIKLSYRQVALDIVDELWEYFKDSIKTQMVELQEQRMQWNDKASAVEQYRLLETEITAYQSKLLSSLEPPIESPTLPDPIQLQLEETQPDNDQEQITFVEHRELVDLSEMFGAQDENKISSFSVEQQQTMQHSISDQLKAVAKLISSVEGLDGNANDLLVKSERLTHNEFTISLFGAFSAGKSSLANALIGEAVLPVSPNPTTAAINSLLPPKVGFEHNTALIYLKSKELMLDDIYYSLSLLGHTISKKAKEDVEHLFKLIDGITPESVHNGGRAHYSFIKAARQGWVTQEQWLGKERKVDRELYVKYVAEEQLSCYVQEIKFYYNCPLTAAGIILVDTPGADSVNARHTGVAFNYIKNTDAIIFVTYYNHAFSHADRQFLNQLGRVKDQFELDKMFFIVNAADLASDSDELQGVLNHVENNLNGHGIMKPRLFPISSIQALEARQSKDEMLMQQSGISAFEQIFFRFIHEELGSLTVDAAKQELLRSQQLVSGLLNGARDAQADKAATLQAIALSEQELGEQIERFAHSTIPQALNQEIEELMYYIIQRIRFRFGDFYNYAFNPSQLRDDVGQLQQAVWTSWLELQRTLALELEQELLATTLRVEKKLKQQLTEPYAQIGQQAMQRLNGYQMATFQVDQIVQPAGQSSWTYDDMKSKWLWSQFKSPKTFFEGEGKVALRKELDGMLFPTMETWMKVVSGEWLQHYDVQWKQLANSQADKLLASVAQFTLQQRKLLSDEAYVIQLQEISRAVNEIVGNT